MEKMWIQNHKGKSRIRKSQVYSGSLARSVSAAGAHRTLSARFRLSIHPPFCSGS